MTDNDNGVGDGGGVVLLRNNVVNNWSLYNGDGDNALDKAHNIRML